MAIPARAPVPPESKPDLALLLSRIAGSDQDAMGELYDDTSTLVYSLALRILGDHAAAEDASIEVYAQVWRSASSFNPTRGTALAWLTTITRTRALDLRRSRPREDPVEDPEPSALHAESPEDPEYLVLAAQRHRHVSGALTKLNPDQREAIQLAYFGGLSHSEIAQRLGEPLGTIKTRIRTGMLRLRELLQHLEPALAAAEKVTS